MVPSVSLIVVSRDRPRLLARLLRALEYQTLPGFDVVVVSPEPPDNLAVRHIPFSERNISAARNAGVAAAFGEIIAFCDDDAVPEPSWLERLTESFANPLVAATGGRTLRRNGVDWQFQGAFIDASGSEVKDRPQAGVQAPANRMALVTIGTNCAFRRSALLEIGGFDPAFRYYLDEADVNWRLARAGHAMAFVPEAVVHHDFADNLTRDARRAPSDFAEIAASKTVFVRKHLAGDPAPALAEFRARLQRQALDAFDLGLLEGQAVAALMQSAERGFADGQTRSFGRAALAADEPAPSLLYPRRDGPRIALCGGPAQKRLLADTARALVAEGVHVSVFCFWPGISPCTVRFSDEGFWVHKGGASGRSDRNGGPRWSLSPRLRTRAELSRIAGQRQFDMIAWCGWLVRPDNPTAFRQLDNFRVGVL